MGSKLRYACGIGEHKVIRIKDIRLGIDQKSTAIIDEAAKILCLDKIYPGSSYPDFSYKILKRSIDARKKPDIYYVYTILVLITDEDEKRILKFFSENHHNRYIRKRNIIAKAGAQGF